MVLETFIPRSVAIIGADTITLPPKVFMEMYEHELTKKGLDTFLKDWAETKQSIL